MRGDALRAAAAFVWFCFGVIGLIVGLCVIGAFGALLFDGRVRVEIPPPVSTQCVDGIVQQGRPGDWVPVKLKGKDMTIPCP